MLPDVDEPLNASFAAIISVFMLCVCDPAGQVALTAYKPIKYHHNLICLVCCEFILPFLIKTTLPATKCVLWTLYC